MQPTPYPYVNELIERLLAQIHAILGKKLVGLYLNGSLVVGDFDENISDIDLIAALASDADDGEFAALQRMHEDFVQEDKAWDNKIEVSYISLAALQVVRSQTSRIMDIRPGDPFHWRESSRQWLVNWYLLREKGKTLFGPPPQTVVEAISQEEFIQSVKDNAQEWHIWIQDMRHRGQQAYAILTLCRALYAVTTGEQVSKKQAALWAARQLPQWSSLILQALKWREAWREEVLDSETLFLETQLFVDGMIERILAE